MLLKKHAFVPSLYSAWMNFPLLTHKKSFRLYTYYYHFIHNSSSFFSSPRILFPGNSVKQERDIRKRNKKMEISHPSRKSGMKHKIFTGVFTFRKSSPYLFHSLENRFLPFPRSNTGKTWRQLSLFQWRTDGRFSAPYEQSIQNRTPWLPERPVT